MKPEFPILRRLQLWFFRICNVGAIGGAGMSVVLLLMVALSPNSDARAAIGACLVAGTLSLTGFYLFSRQIDKIKNDF